MSLPPGVGDRIREYAGRPIRQIAFSDMIKFGMVIIILLFFSVVK